MTKGSTVWLLAFSAIAALGAESHVSTNAPEMEVRFYDLQTNAFYSNLKFQEPLRNETNFYLLRSYFLTRGVDLRPPSTIFLNERTGKLLVRATPEIQKKVQPIVTQLNTKK